MSVTLSEKAYEHIRASLVDGMIEPGHRLVTRKLAEEIGVSLGPVREAIYRLASEGLIRHVPGAGATVHQLSRQELEELYVLRDAIESCAAAEAARYASEQSLDALDSIVDEFVEITASIRSGKSGRATKTLFHRWLEVEERFHELLVASTKNQILAKVIRDTRAISKVFRHQRQTPSLLSLEVAERTSRGRRKLLAAIRGGDHELARQLMSKQIQDGRKTVLSQFEFAT